MAKHQRRARTATTRRRAAHKASWSKRGVTNAGWRATTPSAKQVRGAKSTSKNGRILRRVGYALLILLVVLAAVLFFTERWAMTTWANLSFDEILFHLGMSFEGTNPEMIGDYVRSYATAEVATVAGAGLVLWLCRKHKVAQVASAVLVGVLAIGALGWAVYDFNAQTGALAYVRGSEQGNDGTEFIEANYVDPASVSITFPEKKRNLIYIYLESMETTFADAQNGGAFPKNVIPKLSTIAQQNQTFNGHEAGMSGAYALPGCTWTMGGIFAQSMGVPLKIAVSGNSMDTQDSFFPNLTGLGDILENEGYHQTFLLGSDCSFAGRDLFFKQHGNFDIKDYIYAKDHLLVPKDYAVFWGYEDQKLFSFAKDELKELAAKDEPFNLTLLTVDTHFEDGYVCELCDTEFGKNQYANVFACSDRQVAEFIQWCQQQDFYDNTTIVLAGDHCTMDTDFCEKVPNEYDRRAYATVINSATEPRDSNWQRSYSTLDLFPTTLAALGAEIEGDQLGMGVNLYSLHRTAIEEHGLDVCEEELGKPSEFLESFSGVKLEDIDKDTLLQYARLEAIPLDNDPHLAYRLWGLNTIDRSHIESVRVRMRDTRTGSVTNVPMKFITPVEEATDFYLRATTAYFPKDAEYLQADAFATITGLGEIHVASADATTDGSLSSSSATSSAASSSALLSDNLGNQ